MSIDLKFDAHIQEALSSLVQQDLTGEVAVFDADETLWRHDVGEGFLQWLIQHEHLKQSPPEEGFFARYEALSEQNKYVGYPYIVQIMSGLTEDEVRTLAERYFTEFAHNIYLAQKELIQDLQTAGARVWIVSASNQWLVQVTAPHLGVPVEQVVGMRVVVESGVLTDKIADPITYRQGKVDAIREFIGQDPVLVAGDSMTDYEMLKIAKEIALVINPIDKGPANKNIARLAREHHWLIQTWPKN